MARRAFAHRMKWQADSTGGSPLDLFVPIVLFVVSFPVF